MAAPPKQQDDILVKFVVCASVCVGGDEQTNERRKEEMKTVQTKCSCIAQQQRYQPPWFRALIMLMAINPNIERKNCDSTVMSTKRSIVASQNPSKKKEEENNLSMMFP